LPKKEKSSLKSQYPYRSSGSALSLRNKITFSLFGMEKYDEKSFSAAVFSAFGKKLEKFNSFKNTSVIRFFSLNQLIDSKFFSPSVIVFCMPF
jgi:hypothetical protein